MAESPGTSPALVAALRDLLLWFEAARVRGIVIGGVAVSLLARPRATLDVDALAEVRRAVAAFAGALEAPGILEEFEATVRRARRG